ncbi:beta-ketoacyl-ACP synthase III [Haliangium sp.]|uniref:beta-ketoacyl-ACP synthase III n=1 Tax=Haliangium sp. TaxID=2663208 RepID=UPI003D12C3E3
MSTGTAITGTGVYAPADVITNEELCAVFNEHVRRENERNADAIAAGEVEPLRESSPEFIEKASGIQRRHVHDRSGILDLERMLPRIPDRSDDELCVQAEYSVEAGKAALAAAGRHAEDIDLVILATCTLQRPYPSISVEVQAALGALGHAYDMTMGCSSVTYAIRAASDAIRCGNATRALVVNPELCSPFVDYGDRDSHFIFGDAGTALVIERSDDVAREGGFEILSTRCFSRFSSNIRNNVGHINRCDPDNRFARDKLFYQQGRRVFKDIVPLASQFIIDHLAENGLTPDRVDRYWLHQANSNMNDLIAKRVLGRQPTHEEAPLVLAEYGNTASAGSIIAFDAHHDDLPAGAYGMLCSFGAGYSIGSVLLRRM